MDEKKKAPRLTEKQVADLAYLLAPQIDEYIQENWDRYMAYLEEIKDTNPLAAKELAEIKSRANNT